MPKINTRNGTIHYKDYRTKEHAKPILLIHGAGGSYLDWPIQMRRDLGAITVDLPGHGASGYPHATHIEGYADALITLLDELELTQTTVIGHSMGGAIAQMMALAYPERVQALGLLATSAHLPVNPTLLDGLLNDTETTLQTLVKWMWSNDVPEHYVTQSLERLSETPPQVIHDDFVACNQFDVRQRLAEITCPTLVMAGSADRMIRLEAAEALAEGINDAEIIALDGASHMFPIERAETVTALYQAWLENVQS